jgi:sulfite exporter TauE/SafE
MHLIDLGLMVGAGLLGTSHCLGMCGPYALVIGTASLNWRDNALRQVLYTLGRLFSYTFLGALLGFWGQQTDQSFARYANVPAVLALVAGALLVYQGVAALKPARPVTGSRRPSCWTGPMLMTFLNSGGRIPVFLAGMLTGLLPCGLLYAMLALAGSSRSLLWGMLLMLAFGVGTALPMILLGCGGTLLGMVWRKRLLQLAGCMVLVAGLVSLARGAAHLHLGDPAVGSCPFCRSTDP